jgi:hypothetical protein
MGLVVFISGFGVMVGSLCYLLMTRLSGNVTQLVISLLVGLMMGTVFYANPIIELVRQNLVLRQLVIKMVMVVNPMLVIAGNFFSHDILRGRQLYYLSDIGPFYPYTYPAWGSVLAGYVIISLVAIGLGYLFKIKTSLQQVTE